MKRFAHTQVWPVLRYLLAMRARHRGVEIGVVEHEERRVAAELERHLLHRARALRHE